jgi:hypothetical protein
VLSITESSYRERNQPGARDSDGHFDRTKRSGTQFRPQECSFAQVSIEFRLASCGIDLRNGAGVVRAACEQQEEQEEMEPDPLFISVAGVVLRVWGSGNGFRFAASPGSTRHTAGDLHVDHNRRFWQHESVHNDYPDRAITSCPHTALSLVRMIL